MLLNNFPHRSTVLRFVRRATQILLLLGAGFWTWFVLMHVVHDGLGVLPYAAQILVSLLCPVVLCFVWPRVGGVALICAGVAAWLYFGGGLTSTHAILTLPALVFGAIFLALGFAMPTRSGWVAGKRVMRKKGAEPRPPDPAKILQIKDELQGDKPCQQRA